MKTMGAATRYALAAVVILVALVLAVAVSIYMSDRAISNSQHQWCDTLTLITASPTQPTTENGRIFYARLHELERRFGC